MADQEVTITGLEWVRGKKQPLESFGWLEVPSWEEAALANRDTFASNLRSLGMSDESIFEVLDIRDAGAGKLATAAERLEPYRNVMFSVPHPEYVEAQRVYDSTRESAWRNLRDWWNRRVTSIESIAPLEIDIPLFVLGTPIVPGCKAEWASEKEFRAGSGWSLQIVGSGLGSDVGATFIESASFEASSGETKLIFCPVTVQIERIEIREPKKPVIRQWRIDVAGLSESRLQLGLLLLDPDVVPSRGRSVAKYRLADDPSDSIATYTYKYTQTAATRVNVGINIHDVQLGLSAISTFASGVEVKYLLKTGADYELFRSEDSEGLLFDMAGAWPADKDLALNH